MSKGPQWTFGRFVWHELSTPDMARSQAFYSELLGWKYQSFAGGGAPYQLIMTGGVPQGGLIAGDSAQLLGYVSVPDVDAAAGATSAGGGAVLVPPLEVPGVGRLAVLADASGAGFAVLRNTGGDAPDRGPPLPGQFGWHQLECSPAAAEPADRFYTAVLGWTLAPAAGGREPLVFRQAQRACAGLTTGTAATESRWIGFVVVDDLPAARKRATRLGGQVLVEAMPLGDGGTGALVSDGLGAVIGLSAFR